MGAEELYFCVFVCFLFCFPVLLVVVGIAHVRDVRWKLGEGEGLRREEEPWLFMLRLSTV